MSNIDDWREHYDLVRASTGRPVQKRGGSRQARRSFSLPLQFGKSTRYAIAAVGFLGFFFFPETESRKDYARDDVVSQISSRIGDRVVGSFRLVEADPFPDLALPYDLMVTVSNGDYRAAATIKGELGVDYGLQAIRIISPTEVTALDVRGRGRSAAASAASYAPGILKGLVSTVAGLVDRQGEIRAQADAKAAARNFIIYRISDHDRALFDAKSIRRIERSDAGLSVVYVDGWSASGWSPVYWLFIAMFLLGAVSSIATWR